MSFTAPIHDEIKVWVAENIDRWGVEQKEWFRIEQIPDEFLPATKFLEAGGWKRRRASASFKELMGGG
ncbi:hypothetical protein ScalyP_jg12132 [Parmales sp. scaly parma]|nr:hypothetical protein ScalyP_jg12132 [Parmales sp. scaly parma]